MARKINTIEEFKEIITHKKVVLDCYADWCMPCRMLAEEIESIEHDLSNIEFVKLNVDELGQLVSGVNSIPCLILISDSKELTRIIGYRSASVLKAELEKVFK